MIKKHNIIQCTVVAILLLLVSFLGGCATLGELVGQPRLQAYTFNYDGRDYSALLPKHVPAPPESAKMVPECYRGLDHAVCVMHVQYAAGKEPSPLFPVASFWFTQEHGVVCLVWHTLDAEGARKHSCFVYAVGLPVPASVEDFGKLIDELLSKQPAT